MLKACTLFGRRQDLSVEAAQAYWRGTHAEVVRRVAGVRRYVQCHPIATGEANGFPFDGFAEFYVDDVATLKQMGSTPEFAAMTADEENFIDRSTIVLVLADEFILERQVPAGLGGVKRLSLWRKPADRSPEEYRDMWMTIPDPDLDAAAIVRRSLAFPRLSGYAHGRTPGYDAIVCDWHANSETAGFEKRVAVEPGRGECLGSIYTRDFVVID